MVMSAARRNILIAVLSLLLIAFLGFILVFSGRITMNPEGTVGNTAGNLNNGGLFCEYNGTVYFSNANDGGSLCAMDVNESNVRRLSSLKVGNILAGGKYLYYFQTGGTTSNYGFGQLQGMKSFDRCKLNGEDANALTRDVVVTGQLVDNYLYLLTSTHAGPAFYKLKIDNSEKVDLADFAINPACAVNGKIYYNGTQNDHYLYALNTANDVVTEVWQGNLWYPIVEGDYVYYMDVANNYRLCRYSLSRDSIQILTEERVDCFNVGNGYVYYQTNSKNPALKSMYTDGSNVQVIAEGIFTDINMTSQFVYFRPFNDDTTMYHSFIGSNGYSSFNPEVK